MLTFDLLLELGREGLEFPNPLRDCPCDSRSPSNPIREVYLVLGVVGKSF